MNERIKIPLFSLKRFFERIPQKYFSVHNIILKQNSIKTFYCRPLRPSAPPSPFQADIFVTLLLRSLTLPSPLLPSLKLIQAFFQSDFSALLLLKLHNEYSQFVLIECFVVPTSPFSRQNIGGDVFRGMTVRYLLRQHLSPKTAIEGKLSFEGS